MYKVGIKMNLVENKNKCCGCAVCYNVCPKKAIEMKEDEYGFVYPYINEDKCINCGLCKKMCGYQSIDKQLHEPKQVYAAQTKDDDVIMKSASGGIFGELARNVINNNGIVYGAAMIYEKKSLSVKHIRVDNAEELVKLQGSKYVQSDTDGIYPVIKEDLENDKIVLFSGTSCQVYALRSYLDFKEYENLFTIDIICHGVPNNKMFNDYLNVLKKHKDEEIIEFIFRDKSKESGYNSLARIIRNGKETIKRIQAYNASYYQLFLDSKISRESCYECPYAQKSRSGDITIGDYWNIESEHEEYVDNNKLNRKKGISCVIVNTESGNILLKKFGENIKKYDSTFEKVARNNLQLAKPPIMKDDRREILEIYQKFEYKDVDKLYNKKNFLKKSIKKVFYRLPNKVRQVLKGNFITKK